MVINMRRRELLVSLAASAGLAVAGVARADTKPAESQGKPILTVSGKIGAAEGSAQFDREALERLGMVSFETKTPWYDGSMTFEGVPLAKLMAEVGAKGDRIQAVALNDYSSEIPIEDVAKYNVILALKRNGEYMPVRDKGPLFVVYPYDSDPELKSQKFYSRSVWQVKALLVK
jgi:hypothetical protein